MKMPFPSVTKPLVAASTLLTTSVPAATVFVDTTDNTLLASGMTTGNVNLVEPDFPTGLVTVGDDVSMQFDILGDSTFLIGVDTVFEDGARVSMVIGDVSFSNIPVDLQIINGVGSGGVDGFGTYDFISLSTSGGFDATNTVTGATIPLGQFRTSISVNDLTFDPATTTLGDFAEIFNNLPDHGPFNLRNRVRGPAGITADADSDAYYDQWQALSIPEPGPLGFLAVGFAVAVAGRSRKNGDNKLKEGTPSGQNYDSLRL